MLSTRPYGRHSCCRHRPLRFFFSLRRPKPNFVTPRGFLKLRRVLRNRLRCIRPKTALSSRSRHGVTAHNLLSRSRGRFFSRRHPPFSVHPLPPSPRAPRYVSSRVISGRVAGARTVRVRSSRTGKIRHFRTRTNSSPPALPPRIVTLPMYVV